MPNFTSIGNLSHPTLLFLHGFLGNKEDWKEIIAPLSSKYRCIALDLPGHGKIPYNSDCCPYVLQFIADQKLTHVTLVGYSTGGRIALEISENNSFSLNLETADCSINRLIILSSHLGLTTDSERELCWEKDLHWISLLEKGSMKDFLDKWYEQPIFSTLKQDTALFKKIKSRRELLDPHQMALFLSKQSLSKKPPISQVKLPSLFLYGKEDLKYAELYSKLTSSILETCCIENASHAIHLENPLDCARVINNWLENTCLTSKVNPK